MRAGQLGQVAMYTLFLGGMTYAGATLRADGPCCTYDIDCGPPNTEVVCCNPTSPAGCSKEHYYRCINGCKDDAGNWYCPGSSECTPIPPL